MPDTVFIVASVAVLAFVSVTGVLAFLGGAKLAELLADEDEYYRHPTHSESKPGE